ncbi:MULTISPECIES: type II toxin-antitoxin system RelE/ParE family toxin [Rhizobium]|jgi:toxin ParE1/3/4|uniref:type II toxin-antitoxin system RelE/ParE family toxin n=1 Tax=Rhizobium TaxID=379 RepID=UPI0006491C14|nr:type II toxin-antitoxin system RelE/ParE family toxin [Rhizobium lusitanum]NTJ09859.1 type II toxin-antitoxin system RelE/ParE family toxin [Rhizobium lusitanum]
MVVKLVWSPQAEDDVISIYVEIGLHQPLAAERYYEQFKQKVSLLADQPQLGQRHPEIAASARMLVEAPYVILYETIPDADQGPVDIIQIVRVVDGRRDLRNFLKS